tara:strand:- start:63 stop:398 length:336 start_codon:yes stop_codon:yes gene_type:complete
MFKLIKLIDSKLAELLITVLRVISGMAFYGFIIGLLTIFFVMSNESLSVWYYDLVLNEHEKYELLIELYGLVLNIFSALLYLLIPIRHFGILMSPFILIISIPIYFVFFSY